jgi:cytochrome c biogenesis protein
VNDALEWEGLTFYQATFSERPDLSFAQMSIKDLKTGEMKDVRASPQNTFSHGDGSVQYKVVDFDPNFGELGPAVHVMRREMPKATGDNVAPEPTTSSFWVFANYPEFDEKFRGDQFALKFDKLVPTYVTGIQVARDPGRPIVYVGCFLLFAGLFVSFWTAHRRLWARVEDGKIVFAGAAHRNKDQFKTEFDRIVGELVEPKSQSAGV